MFWMEFDLFPTPPNKCHDAYSEPFSLFAQGHIHPSYIVEAPNPNQGPIGNLLGMEFW